LSRSKPASNVEWQKWGEIDPLFAVASWEGHERSGATPWNDAEFYALGASDWRDCVLHWQRYGLKTDACLEIGCGAGRITKWLAESFSATYALDISPEMIQYAKNHIDHRSVEFVLSDGAEIPLPDSSISSVFSTHVFQHFDSFAHADAYFAEISRVLQADGTIMIHLPIYRWPAMGRLFGGIYKLRRILGNVRAAVNRLLTVHNMAKPIMRGTVYPISYFYSTLPRLGFEDIEVHTFLLSSNRSMHPFVFARKGKASKSIV